MEIPVSNGPVTVVGGGQSTDFGIKNNAKMFRILSDTMYKDKPGSIVREIACNCLDGHTAAGCIEKPFVIHLPDGLEPWISFKDEGTGLSPDAMTETFCIYGESTKDSDNQAVGAFGLGAKTPFSYTDQFNITSIYKGVKYAYAAMIGANGVPSLMLMGETPTDEPNGVEVKMGVKPTDFQKFIAAVKTQLRFFKVKPTIINHNEARYGAFTFDTEEPALFESESIKIHTVSGYGKEKVHIVQGPVGYPLDYSQMESALDEKDRVFLKTLYNVGANLYFNIGEIGVIASREGVDYSPFTIANIKARVEKAHDEVVKWIESQMATLPTVWEKALFVNSNQSFAAIMNGLTFDLAPAQKFYNGQYGFVLGESDVLRVDSERTDHAGNVTKIRQRATSIMQYGRTGVNGFSGSKKDMSDTVIYPEAMKTAGGIAIVLRDTAKTPVAKMRHYFKESGLRTMYAISPTHDKMVFDSKLIAELSKSLGGFVNIKLVSELPDAPRAVYDRSRTDYSRPTAYRCGTGGHSDMDSVANWKRVFDKLGELKTDDTDDADDIEKALYVTVERQRITDVSSDIKSLYQDLARAGAIDIPLFAIRAGDVEKLADSDIEWIKLEDYVQVRKAEVIADPAIKRYTLATSVRDIVQNALGHRFDELTNLNPRTRLARLMTVKEKASKIANGCKINHHILRIAAYDAGEHPVIAATRKATKNVFDRTPMIRYVSRGGYGSLSGDEAKHVAEYINMFDK